MNMSHTDTVGVLLDQKTFKGIPSNRTGNERLSLYNKAAKQLKLKLFYMSLPHIGKKSALGFVFAKNMYRLKRQPIPNVMHNRAITLSPNLKRKLKQLSQSSTVFNRQNRYDKYRIYKLIYQNANLRQYLPISMKYSKEQLLLAMNKYSSLFIKPTNNSVGNGILKLSKHESGKWLLYWKKGNPKLLTGNKAVIIIARHVGTQTYMIQEAIPLATYNGRPYDLRVSVQRGETGRWQVTGMIGKVAASGRHVTNVAKGGKVKRTEELFKLNGLDPERMKEAIREAALSIMHDLSGKLPNLADVGLDIGIDHQGRIKFIEMNGRDQRYTFKKAKMNKTFYRTYETPLQYAKYLLNQSSS
ncbi:YheC/YheD family protein [Paenibacillus aceris]|uniref:Glutathione synthase/RimK-type ligase-like ATP-grasp enzyme n=1 Tax=Paenibacillus aceris TaxID=869555 RepID=A0ABS4I6U0_9BACL|nr:YheC/YheD family protein [Paenibacillus aceris]MBP1966610.1 glutathione synthase/RimK-type ligase-like ATP-grasp enzyme [Paenibacillus aceris]NHW38846.1 YheC/YheD family protein [Paenibacillus aceris]